MINITLLDETKTDSLKKFGAQEWPGADREHFGDKQVDFTKPEFTLVAHDGTTVVGYIKCIFDMGVLYLDSIIVAEKYRGQGIATRLVTAAEDKGKIMGAHKIKLETGSDWKARGFYEKLGFKVRARLDNYYAHQDFVLMDKDV